MAIHAISEIDQKNQNVQTYLYLEILFGLFPKLLTATWAIIFSHFTHKSKNVIVYNLILLFLLKL